MSSVHPSGLGTWVNPVLRAVSSVALSSACWLALSFVPSLAVAQGVDEFGAYGYDETPDQTPQDFAFELRFGPYRPNIDDEFAGAETPFELHFGGDTRWSVGFELDWQVLRIPYVGTLGPGFGAAFTRGSLVSYLEDGSVAGSQETQLNILPMYGVAVLRIDPLIRYTPVPLAFSAKAGIGYAMWWISGDEGVVRDDTGYRAEDTSWGTQWALGVQLHLNPFDRFAAQSLDTTYGINNSYVFIEWYRSDLNGLGSSQDMQVGTSTWIAGITLEM